MRKKEDEEDTRMDGSKVDREGVATAAGGLETKGATAPLSVSEPDPLSGREYCPRCGSGPRQAADVVECPDCGYQWSGPRLLDVR